MDVVERELANIGKYLASTTRLTVDLENNLPSHMTDFNSKVDLRPTWMIDENSLSRGKPHVNSVLQPEQRSLGIPRSIPRLSPEQLQGVTLRKTGTRGSIEAEGMRTVEDRSELVNSINLRKITSPNRQMNSTESPKVENSRTYDIPPPPPPPPGSQRFSQLRETPDCSSAMLNGSKNSPFNYVDYDQSYVSELREKEKAIKNLEAKLTEMECYIASPQLKEDESTYRSLAPFIKRERAALDTRGDEITIGRRFRQKDDGFNLNRKFDEEELDNDNTKRWIDELVNDRFERLSRIDTLANIPHTQGFINDNSASKAEKAHSKTNNNHKRSSSRHSRRSKADVKPRDESPGSIKSVARSIKSVLFRKTEEEELCSEIDDEDVADINAGKIDFVDYTSEKFTIHGPFVDRELNVFHAICAEYQLAARISFAKRSAFARTNPAHERVYALIGSNRRSSWTNRNSWSNATNDLQVLDFIFRKIIRSVSKRIREPVMELEHFSEGSTLDTRKFWKIMRSIFKKREHLAQVLNINVEKYEDIK